MIPNDPTPSKPDPEDSPEDLKADGWADLDAEAVPAEASEVPAQEPAAVEPQIESEDPQEEEFADPTQQTDAEASREEIRARRMRPSVDVMPDAEKVFEKGARPGPEDIEDKEWAGTQPVGFKWIALAGGGIIALILICLVILHLRRSQDSEVVVVGQNNEQSEALKDLNAEVENLAKRKDEAIDMFADFATASLVEEILPLIRNSSDMESLVRRVGHEPMAKKGWEPSVHSRWSLGVSSRGVHARLQGELPDYSRFRAYFMIEQGQLVMDWKATTGYSTASFEQLMQGEGDGSEIRGILRPSALYVGPYDELNYDCYQLESPNGLDLIWCYAESGTDTERILSAKFRKGSIIEDETSTWPITLKLVRGPEGALKNQWLIEKLLHEEWIGM